MNGNREQTNNYTIDGVDMNESIDNLVAYQPSPDALAQISVETNNYSADTGNVAGAVISNVLKSGSNRFRGNAFEYYRNSKIDANSWSNNRSGAAKPKRRQDIFGGTLGGPLVRNKLFFFANYQGTQFDAPGFETVSVAPAAWRRGDLSSVTNTIRDPLTGVAFAGNQIPSGRISPIASGDPEQHGALSAAEPQRPGGITGNFVGETLTTVRPTRETRASTGTPPRPTRCSDASRWPSTSRRTTSGRCRCCSATAPTAPFRNLALNWNHVFSPSLINEVLVGYNQIAIVTDTLDWVGHRQRQHDVRDPGRAADRRPQLDRLGRRPDRRSAPAPAIPTPSTRPIRSTRS